MKPLELFILARDARVNGIRFQGFAEDWAQVALLKPPRKEFIVEGYRRENAAYDPFNNELIFRNKCRQVESTSPFRLRFEKWYK